MSSALAIFLYTLTISSPHQILNKATMKKKKLRLGDTIGFAQGHTVSSKSNIQTESQKNITKLFHLSSLPLVLGDSKFKPSTRT